MLETVIGPIQIRFYYAASMGWPAYSAQFLHFAGHASLILLVLAFICAFALASSSVSVRFYLHSHVNSLVLPPRLPDPEAFARLSFAATRLACLHSRSEWKMCVMPLRSLSITCTPFPWPASLFPSVPGLGPISSFLLFRDVSPSLQQLEKAAHLCCCA